MKPRITPRVLSYAAAALVLLTGVLWLAGELTLPPANPPGRHTGPILSAASDPLLRRACFDCHSNETTYPWYAHLPGVSLVLGAHIREGRHELNFSFWDRLEGKARRKAFKESLETMLEGEMPPMSYTAFNTAGRLSRGETRLLMDDLRARAGPPEARGKWGHSEEAEEEHGKRRGEWEDGRD